MAEQDQYTETDYLLIDLAKPGPLQDARVRCAMSMAIDRQEINDLDQRRHPEDRQRPVLARPGGLPRRQRVRHRPEPRRGQEADRRLQVGDRHESTSRSTSARRPTRSPSRRPSCTRATGRRSGSTRSSTPCRRTSIITNALFGVPTFQVYGWRNHAGLFVDQQNFWWNSASGVAGRRAGAELRPAQRPDGRRRPGDRPQRPGRGQAQGGRRGHQPDDGQELLPDPDHLGAVGHAAQGRA